MKTPAHSPKRLRVKTIQTSDAEKKPQNGYHLVMTNSSPWKITMLCIGKPSISMGHGFHGELLNNQRVYKCVIVQIVHCQVKYLRVLITHWGIHLGLGQLLEKPLSRAPCLRQLHVSGRSCPRSAS